MVPRSDSEVEVLWSGFADRLRRELAATSDPGRRQRLLHALARTLGDWLDSEAEALRCLEAALEADPTVLGAAFDAWRMAGSQPAEQRLAALERLKDALDRREDMVAVRLAIALLLKNRLGDDRGAEQEAAEAQDILPDHPAVLLMLAVQAAERGGVTALLPHYEKIAAITSDEVLKAALLAEIAEAEAEVGRPREDVERRLGQVIELAAKDFAVANSVLRTSEKIGAWSIHERAALTLAEAALRTASAPPASPLPGYALCAFDTGQGAAAAWYWYAASVRESRLGDPAGALGWLDKARENLPGHSFLDIERARLLEAAGKPEEALAAVPDEASDTWKAELALCAGRIDLAASLACAARDGRGSVLAEVLAELSSGTDDPPPGPTADPETLRAWYESHPRHPDAPRIAARLVEANPAARHARLAVAAANERGAGFPRPDPLSTAEPWPLAVEAVLGASEPAAQAYLAWADRVTDLSLKALLTGVAARMMERAKGPSEEVLSLHRRAEELDPETAAAASDILRLERVLGHNRELAAGLVDLAADTDPAVADMALYERAMLLEHSLDDTREAAAAFADLVGRHKEDVVARWSALRLAFYLGDTPLVVRHLDDLARICPEDRPLFDLLAGEIRLFRMGHLDEALQCFERAERSEEPSAAFAARLYRLLVLYQLGDREALCDLLAEDARRGASQDGRRFLAEVLELGRELRAPSALLELFDADDPSSEALLWRLMLGLSNDTASAEACLRKLGGGAPPGEMAGACRTAAALLGGGRPSADEDFMEADLESREALTVAADRAAFDEDPLLLTEIYRERAALAEADELEWIDWILCESEAEERSGNREAAIENVRAALQRSPEHPGLLEARARLATALGLHAEAADTHGRLARFYASEEQKAFNLALAAAILFDKLGDDKGAENICNEALRRAPGHPEAHEVLVRIFKSRGDEGRVAELIGQRIDSEKDRTELADLYEEQADQMMMIDDTEGALAAIDKLIETMPERLSAYLTKIDLLSELERWPDAIAAMREHNARAGDPVEVRTMSWRAVDLLVDVMGDTEQALAWLTGLVEGGDRHPETERKIARIAAASEQWETAAEALSRLAALLPDGEKKVRFQLEEIEIRLEHLFDDEGATRIVDDILAKHPADLATHRIAHRFLDEEAARANLARAISKVREGLAERPTDLELIASLRELAKLNGEEDLVRLCDDILLLLSGGTVDPWPGDLVPAAGLDAETLRRFFVHPNELSAVARVAEMAGSVTAEVFGDVAHLPRVSRSTRIDDRADDPVSRCILAWAALLGYQTVEMHRAGDGAAGSAALPGETPAVAVTADVKSPLSARHRFFLARNLWRSARGLACFQEDDLAGPAAWVVAVTAAILGERIELPLPADADLVTRAKKALPRRLRRSLVEPCGLLLKENRQSLRAWAQAMSFSADRFGLLAATRLNEVIAIIVEETAGATGLKKLSEEPGPTILRIPRCAELLRFAFSEQYLAARRQVGLKVLGEGGRS